VSPSVIFLTYGQIERAIARIRAIKPDEEKPMALWIGPYRKIRTLAQNSKYWSRVSLITKATGHSKIALHEYFKKQAFGVAVDEIDGKMIEYTQSSAKSDRGDFSELIEYVEQFIAEHHIEDSA
jgi:hypothetical protein